MQYDSNWTPQERARVEALRLIRQGAGRNLTAEQLVAEMVILAKAIEGPEAANPFPWDDALAARQELWDLFTKARREAGLSTSHQWSVPTDGDMVTLAAFPVYQALHKLPDRIPF